MLRLAAAGWSNREIAHGLHLAEGKLKAVFGFDKAVRVEAHFAVYPARHAKRPAVKAFLAWLHAQAARP